LTATEEALWLRVRPLIADKERFRPAKTTNGQFTAAEFRDRLDDGRKSSSTAYASWDVRSK
jgi:hypothetical protein